MKLSENQVKQLEKFLNDVRKKNLSAAPVASVPQFVDGCKIITYEDGDWLYRDVFFGDKVFSGEIVVFYKNMVVWTVSYRGKFITDTSPSLIKFCIKNALQAQNPETLLRGPKEYITSNKLYKYDNSATGDILELSGRENVSIITNGNRPYLVYRMRYSGGIIE